MEKLDLLSEIERLKEGFVDSTMVSIDNYSIGKHTSVNKVDTPLEYMEGYVESLVHVYDIIEEDFDIEDFGFTEQEVNSCISKCDEILIHIND